MRLPKRLRPCEALPRLAAVMAGYLGRSPAAARYPPMAWIPIAAIPLGSSRAPSAPHILVELREIRSEEHTSELQTLMRISYAVLCLKTKTNRQTTEVTYQNVQI